MRVALLGGLPPALGGGGLEVQMERTARALAARGHTVVRLDRDPNAAGWDVLHAFGAEGNVQFFLEHWTRNRSPLVISPVLVVSPGREELALKAMSRAPGPATHAGERRRALRRADVLVAITGYERDVLRAVTGNVPVEVVPNGVDPVEPAAGDGPAGHALLLGTVSERKRQREVVAALAGAGPIVVAGGFHGSDAERAAFESAVAAAGADWLGEVRDPRRVARLQRDAAALVHFSRAEVQSLAVLETLAQGTPVVLSDIPSHRELAAEHPRHVRIAGSLEELAPAVAQLRGERPGGPPPEVPTWDDVAARLEAIYRRLS
jgi:glycosyltransferase involved in cell wall biosynthesis